MSRPHYTSIGLVDPARVFTTANGEGGGATHYLGPFPLEDADDATIQWTRFSAATSAAIFARPGVGSTISTFELAYTAVPTDWLMEQGREARRDPTRPYFFAPGAAQFPTIPGTANTDEGDYVQLQDNAWTNFMIRMVVTENTSGIYLAKAHLA